jgi:hypothetical protein
MYERGGRWTVYVGFRIRRHYASTSGCKVANEGLVIRCTETLLPVPKVELCQGELIASSGDESSHGVCDTITGGPHF